MPKPDLHKHRPGKLWKRRRREGGREGGREGEREGEREEERERKRERERERKREREKGREKEVYVDIWKKCSHEVDVNLAYLEQQGKISQYGRIE
jgi:hypothetical protein